MLFAWVTTSNAPGTLVDELDEEIRKPRLFSRSSLIEAAVEDLERSVETRRDATMEGDDVTNARMPLAGSYLELEVERSSVTEPTRQRILHAPLARTRTYRKAGEPGPPFRYL